MTIKAQEDKLYRVRNNSGIDVRVLAPNPQVARFLAKQSHRFDKKALSSKLQVIKARER